jgi:hypothetical protein
LTIRIGEENRMTVLDLLQWRAMMVTVLSGWFVASREAVLDFPHSIRLRQAAQFARPSNSGLVSDDSQTNCRCKTH